MLFPNIASAGPGEEKFNLFVAALKGKANQSMVFSQSEAIAVLNAGAQVMFEDMPSVSAYCTNVAIQGNLLDVKRIRVGIFPMSITAFLTTIMAVGCPEYMQVYPLSGKVVIRKRGYVQYLDSIEITARGIEVSVLGQ